MQECAEGHQAVGWKAKIMTRFCIQTASVATKPSEKELGEHISDIGPKMKRENK